jgi:hypothetical protein
MLSRSLAARGRLQRQQRSNLWSQLHWTSTQPVALLPFPARCDAALIHERGITTRQQRLLGVVGGQLSYDDDSGNCNAPILTVNEAFYSS